MLARIVRDVPNDWLALINASGDLRAIAAQLEPDQHHLCPPPEQILEFARLTNLSDIRAIIVGQDPYHTPGEAHGLAFSSKTSVPPSLRNIKKAIAFATATTTAASSRDGNGRGSGDLTYLARQGVLLLNTALTTICGKPNAHHKLWNSLTTNIIVAILKGARGPVSHAPPPILLWGKQAGQIGDIIERQVPGARCLRWSHPSPVAQARLPADKQFINCPHFRMVNEMLPADRKIAF